MSTLILHQSSAKRDCWKCNRINEDEIKLTFNFRQRVFQYTRVYLGCHDCETDPKEIDDIKTTDLDDIIEEVSWDLKDEIRHISQQMIVMFTINDSE